MEHPVGVARPRRSVDAVDRLRTGLRQSRGAVGVARRRCSGAGYGASGSGWRIGLRARRCAAPAHAGEAGDRQRGGGSCRAACGRRPVPPRDAAADRRERGRRRTKGPGGPRGRAGGQENRGECRAHPTVGGGGVPREGGLSRQRGGDRAARVGAPGVAAWQSGG